MARLTLNKVELGGNLTDAPSLVQVGSKTVCNVTIAVNERYQTRDGENKEETTFIDLSAWDKLGERLGELQKGDNIYVEGKIRLDQWEKDGEKRQKHRVNVRTFQYLGDRKMGGSSDDSSDSADNSNPAPATEIPEEKGNPFNSEQVV